VRLLAEYNFKEIRYVPGPDNVVPDFLSRPWEGGKSPPPFHMFVQSVTPRLSCLHGLQRSVHSSVIVLPLWRGHIVLHRDGVAGLWAVILTPKRDSLAGGAPSPVSHSASTVQAAYHVQW